MSVLLQERPVGQKILTPDEYLEFEEASDVRHEYRHGAIIAMSGASEAHNDIVANLMFSLKRCLRGSDCKIFANGMRVKVEATGARLLPCQKAVEFAVFTEETDTRFSAVAPDASVGNENVP